MVGCESSKVSVRLQTQTSSAAERQLMIATRVGSASALKRAASSSRSGTVSGSVSGPQQIVGRTAIDFIELFQYISSMDIDERRSDGGLRLPTRLLLRRLLLVRDS